MGLRGKLGRLEYKLRGNMESFILEDGSRYYFDPKSGELFLHLCGCIRAGYEGKPYPEPPATLLALCKARDRRASLAAAKVATDGMFPYDLEVLVERGELVPRSLVAGRELGGPIEDLSE
jgi:hypothetical protein